MATISPVVYTTTMDMNASLDLFEHGAKASKKLKTPLAARMRPRNFDEFVGQEHILGPNKPLRTLIESDQTPSMILWGPPGSGKTTLAFVVAKITYSHFEPMSAVTSGVADLRQMIEQAKERHKLYGKNTIIFIDEIHRFNKAQQDVILPHVEDGTITLIGATTENPSFEVISALLSRSQICTLHQLTTEDIESIVSCALIDTERGLGQLRLEFGSGVMTHLVKISNGDARIALNMVEMAAQATIANDSDSKVITLTIVEDVLQRRSVSYDKLGDQHYDTISAFIKSVRGSSPDGAIYWLGRMIEAGEDPKFIARRLVILAAEDIGLANPTALPIAVAAQQAVHMIGMPEGAIPLAEATVYLATSPKSNTAYLALKKAMEDVRNNHNEPVPIHLRNATTNLMAEMGYGKGYKYSHSFPGHFTPQEFLPTSLRERRYYEPSDQGYEQEISNLISHWWNDQRQVND